MANRFWVGGSGTWNSTNTANWSTSSGGSGGASVPTSADDVIINANSGDSSAEIAINYGPGIRSLNTTGFTGGIYSSGGVNGPVILTGGLTIGSGTQFITNTNLRFRLSNSSGAQTITSNGVFIPRIEIMPNTNVSLSGSLSVYAFTVTANSSGNCTFSTGNNAMTIQNLLSLQRITSNVATFNAGSSTLTIGGMGVSQDCVFNANTSTVNFVTPVGSLASLISTTPNLTFNNVGISRSGSFTSAKTYTINGTLTIDSGLTLTAITPGSPFTLSKASGIVEGKYLSIKDSTVTGGATWNAYLSTNHGGNTGWNFIPVLSETSPVTAIAMTSAILNGSVASTAIIIERGFVWSTSANPTIADNKIGVAGTTGTYSAPLTGLTKDTTYYVRAYAIDSTTAIYYGDDETFDTLLVPANSLNKDIGGVAGHTYAVSLDIGGTTGTVTVKIGSSGYSQVFDAGEGTVTLQGVYGGVIGLIIEASNDFDGWVDNVYWLEVTGTGTIDWNKAWQEFIFPINSSVLFRRFEDEEFNRFRIYRYLDIQFKDLDAYVTVLLKKEANENLTTSEKEFLVSNESIDELPFINKRISLLARNQSIRVKLSNNRLNEKFTVCQFILKGFEQPRNMFDSSKIINID